MRSIEVEWLVGRPLAECPPRAGARPRFAAFDTEEDSQRRVGRLDAFDSRPGAAHPAFSDREFQSRRGPCPPPDECAGSVLHDAFSAATLGLFPFRFRTRVFLLLVREDFRIASGGSLDVATVGNSEPWNCGLGCSLDFLFQLHAMVVLIACHAAGNGCELGDVPWLRAGLFARNETLETRADLCRLRLLRSQFRSLSLPAFPDSVVVSRLCPARGPLAGRPKERATDPCGTRPASAGRVRRRHLSHLDPFCAGNLVYDSNRRADRVSRRAA